MPAGDAGLERQPADSEYQTICGWVTTYGWLNAAMAERVRQLLHRQQAVIDAARLAVGGSMGGYVVLKEALTALDSGKAQPEVECAG